MEMTYRIRPKEVNREGKTLIRLDLHWHDQRLRMSARKFCRPENFDPKGKKLIKTGEENSLALNWELTQLRQDITALFLELERSRVLITPDLFKRRIEALLNVTRAAPLTLTKTVWDYLDEWQRRYQTRYSPSYLRRFTIVKPWVEQYRPGLTPEEINEEFILGYRDFLARESSLADNTVSIHLKFFRLILKQARLPSEWLRDDNQHVPKGNSLLWTEVRQLYEHGQRHGFVKDTDYDIARVMVFLCLTGLRYGDYLRLTPRHVVPRVIHGQSVLLLPAFQQHKTKSDVDVLLPPEAVSIWHHYDGQLPKYTNQFFNREIKRVARAAGLSREVTLTIVRDKIRRDYLSPLWQAISAHMGRHTYGSLILEGSGNDFTLAKEALGHRNVHVTRVYAQVKQDHNLQQMQAAWQRLASTKNPD